jgi:hypothetical protein
MDQCAVAMTARFHFNLVRGHVRIVDRTGLEVRRDEVMSSAVYGMIRKIWPGTADRNGWGGWSVEVMDAEGTVVRVIALV